MDVDGSASGESKGVSFGGVEKKSAIAQGAKSKSKEGSDKSKSKINESRENRKSKRKSRSKSPQEKASALDGLKSMENDDEAGGSGGGKKAAEPAPSVGVRRSQVNVGGATRAA